MSDTSFTYTTYIDTVPEALWAALTNPEELRLFWGAALLSTWQVGAPVNWEQGGVTVIDPAQVVLEADRPRRLAYTWHTFTPEFAATCGIFGEELERVNAEPRSKVTFDIEPVRGVVALRLVHDGFEPGSSILESVSEGWPYILSNLKSLLETGEVLFTQ
jgi:uncharacterized protein YndB with AHSA1/START domain